MIRPVRLQLSRKRGFNLQALSLATNGLAAVNCARPSRWGNPFIVGKPSGYEFEDDGDPKPMIEALTLEQALEFFENAMHGIRTPEMHPWGHRWVAEFEKHKWHPMEAARQFLRGKNLGCFCALDRPCHVDIYLRELNR